MSNEHDFGADQARRAMLADDHEFSSEEKASLAELLAEHDFIQQHQAMHERLTQRSFWYEVVDKLFPKRDEQV